MPVSTISERPDLDTGPLLRVRDLAVEFRRGGTDTSTVRAVNGVSLELAPATALGILGESGSGKSVTAKALMGILPVPAARVTGGSALLRGELDLLSMDERTRRRTIGSRVAMVFQDALTALNPVHPVGRQIAELYRVHRGMSRAAARQAAVRMMDRVRIPDAARRAGDYPHQFSGGMRQRIVIAMALALDPEVLIADEPTTALDVTVQAQILDLLREQQQERRMGLILITHDISVVSEVTDEVAVMYAGRLVEQGPTGQVLARPAHPYTVGLSRSVAGAGPDGRLPAIPGAPPDLALLPGGCSFAPRCAQVRDRCLTEVPVSLPVGPGRRAACHVTEEVLVGGR
ncbi:ABC transporter ATP-binding protein [Ornithinimicrobium sp. LYQ92]|uniref:ABC transporter ATP-binding protein n=1 Tax=Serinicoccus sp. LYQ92 TaxID=3378798 RepID=UPI0038533452